MVKDNGFDMLLKIQTIALYVLDLGPKMSVFQNLPKTRLKHESDIHFKQNILGMLATKSGLQFGIWVSEFTFFAPEYGHFG